MTDTIRVPTAELTGVQGRLLKIAIRNFFRATAFRQAEASSDHLLGDVGHQSLAAWLADTGRAGRGFKTGQQAIERFGVAETVANAWAPRIRHIGLHE